MDNQSFEYNYCAKEQAEIKKIREKYAPPPTPELSKLEQLRLLDARVTQKGTVAALVLGIIGALFLGTGMSMIMTEFSALFGNWAVPAGLLIGIVGMALVILAYPAYNKITQKEREKIAPEIIRLSDELMR